MTYVRNLNSKEFQSLDIWRAAHGCLSNIEIKIIPDQVDQSTKVRCLKCDETVDITDWDAA